MSECPTCGAEFARGATVYSDCGTSVRRGVMVTPEGQAMLVDFGLAREFDPHKSISLTGTPSVTPGYAPFEQYSQRGRFGSETLRPPQSLRSEVSEETNRAVLWAMEMQAADRPQSAAKFVSSLPR